MPVLRKKDVFMFLFLCPQYLSTEPKYPPPLPPHKSPTGLQIGAKNVGDMKIYVYFCHI